MHTCPRHSPACQSPARLGDALATVQQSGAESETLHSPAQSTVRRLPVLQGFPLEPRVRICLRAVASVGLAASRRARPGPVHKPLLDRRLQRRCLAHVGRGGPPTPCWGPPLVPLPPGNATQTSPGQSGSGQHLCPHPVSAEPGTTPVVRQGGGAGARRPRGVQSHRGPWWDRGPWARSTQTLPSLQEKARPLRANPPSPRGPRAELPSVHKHSPPRAGSKPRQGASWGRVCALGDG